MMAARCCPESRDAPPGLTISRIVVKQVEMADRGTTNRARQFHEEKSFAQPNKRPDTRVKPRGEHAWLLKMPRQRWLRDEGPSCFWQVPSSAIQKMFALRSRYRREFANGTGAICLSPSNAASQEAWASPFEHRTEPSRPVVKLLFSRQLSDRPQEPIASLGVVGAGNNSAKVALCLGVFGDGRALGSSYR